MQKLTPLMQQYWEIKSLHSDKIVFFRMGDFYELFYADAQVAAPLLGIALTQRNKKSEEETPMCGVPHHSVAGQINKLLKLGFKVALCDQVEDPSLAKGIVKRAITRILTPGMVYDIDQISENNFHYICALKKNEMAFIEVTTGESFVISVNGDEDCTKFLFLISPAEVVYDSATAAYCEVEKERAKNRTWTAYTQTQALENQTMDLLNGQPVDGAAALLLSYYVNNVFCYHQDQNELKRVQKFKVHQFSQFLELSAVTVQSLELFKNYQNEEEGSFFKAVNRTKTFSGARLLKNWIQFPLTKKSEILSRLTQVKFWKEDYIKLKKLREILGQQIDLERRLTKVTSASVIPRELASLVLGIVKALDVLEFVGNSEVNDYQTLKVEALKVGVAFKDDLPISTRQGGIFNKGYHSVLDELIDLSTNSQTLLLELEQRERQSTGISSLKIRYNNVFGYYIEVTNTHKDKIPDHYKRKQTLANAERYYTEELIELEKKILTADSKRNELESEVFQQLRIKFVGESDKIRRLAEKVSSVDVISSLAWLAIEQNYCEPIFTDQDLNLKSSRHPVVEQIVKKNFVANDISISKESSLLITGPNMAGKSTLMRQVALTIIMAQMGSFVPCASAEIPLFDKIFTRIGASDSLSQGLSTFMVEMKETADLLNHCTEKSFIVLDEIGRGTSTYDGLSLAQSILEYILNQKKAITMFATHYHEMTGLDLKYSNLKNKHMSVYEGEGTIRFAYILKEGPATKSYGIHVAEIAGVPLKVIQDAYRILNELEDRINLNAQESSDFESKTYVEKTSIKTKSETTQLSLVDFSFSKEKEFLEKMSKIDLNQLTPLQAINLIAEWKDQIAKIL